MWTWLVETAKLAYSILAEAGRRYGEDRVSRMSAAVAYRAIFSLAPLMLIAVWVFGLVIGDSAAARQEVYDRIAAFAGGQLADAVRTLVDTAVTGGDTAAVVGFALLLWTSSSLFLEVQMDLNDIFGVPSFARPGVVAFIITRGLGFLWTLGLGVLLIAIWGINIVWGWFEAFFDERGLGRVHDVIDILRPVVSILILPVVFALIFQSLTRIRVRRRALFVGALFTSVVFLAAAYGIGIYFGFGGDTSASRVAGAFFVVLLAAFVLSAVFLYGAEVTDAYEDYLESGRVDSSEPQPELVVAQPQPPLPVVSLMAFLAGLLVGWRRRR
jgi:membrane protein